MIDVSDLIGRHIKPDDLEAWCRSAMIKNGLSESDARIAADIFTSADTRGIHSHGTRQIRQLMNNIKDGRINPHAKPEIFIDLPAAAIIDGNNAMPTTNAAEGMRIAIEKAKSNDTENYSSARYEGFGSGGGSSIIIDCLTDNPNRTIANLRACFNKAHAKLGVGGSVSFNYEHTGLIVIDYDDEEAMMDALIMAEVDLKDIEVEDGVMTITVEPSDLSKTKEAVEQLIPDVEFKVMEDTMLPNDYVELEGEDLELFKRLVTLLDDVDDVQNVYHNVKNINA